MKIFIVGNALDSFAIEEKEVHGIDNYAISKDANRRSRVAAFAGCFFTSKEDAEKFVLTEKEAAKESIRDYIGLLKSQSELIDNNDFKICLENKEIAFAFNIGFIF